MNVAQARDLAIRLLNAVALIAVAPLALTARLEALARPSAEGWYLVWAQLLAGVPGFPGVYLRRAYYRCTLESCNPRSTIGYGAIFAHRQASIGAHVYVGPYALIGCATLEAGCLIGSRASLTSGPNLHVLDDEGRWMPTDRQRLQRIRIGAHAWIGEGAIVMADIGRGAMVAAGGVVSSPVKEGVLVAGNPARYVRQLLEADQRPAPAGV
jgi:virginiamycin A acetyltransferase